MISPDSGQPSLEAPPRGADRGIADVGPDSVAWKIHGEVVLLLGWGRALLLQLAHPLVACGVAEHSSFLTEPKGRYRRLWRTLDSMLALTFGPPESAQGILRHINGIHDRVHGLLQEDAGSFPAGTSYSAHDPALLRWVHATLLDTFLLTYEFYVAPLSLEQKDRYCAEASWIEAPLGIPEGYLPKTLDELQRYMKTHLASGEIAVTQTARSLAAEIVSPARAGPAKPLFRFVRLPAIGLLPEELRIQYGFSWDKKQEAALHRSAERIRRLLPWTPSFLRLWPRARRSLLF